MRKVIKTLPFLLLLLSIGFIPARAGSAYFRQQSQDPQAQDPPSQVEKVARGQLVGIDPDSNTLTIRMAGSQEMKFAYDRQHEAGRHPGKRTGLVEWHADHGCCPLH